MLQAGTPGVGRLSSQAMFSLSAVRRTSAHRKQLFLTTKTTITTFFLSFLFTRFYFNYMYAPLWVCAGARVGLKRVSGLWDLELQTVVSHLTRVLGGAGNLAQLLRCSGSCSYPEPSPSGLGLCLMALQECFAFYLTCSALSSLLQTSPPFPLSDFYLME